MYINIVDKDKGEKTMNKNKAQKIIKLLKEDFRMNETMNNRLYVETWVIGALETIEEKMNGTLPHRYNDTYKNLFNDFDKYFHCENISEHIESETKERLLTLGNISLFYQLKRCMGLERNAD